MICREPGMLKNVSKHQRHISKGIKCLNSICPNLIINNKKIYEDKSISCILPSNEKYPIKAFVLYNYL